MRRIISLWKKVVFVLILLFLCLSFKPVKAFSIFGHEIEIDFDIFNMFDKDDEIEESKESTAIGTAIDNEQGGLFESTIAKALGGIAQAVFNIASSDTINLGFKNYDKLIFNRKEYIDLSKNNISPFTSVTWRKVMNWYRFFSILAFVPILIGAIITSYRFIIAGTSINKRNEAKDSFMRLFLGGGAIALAPIFVKLVLIINANMVAILVKTTSANGLDGLLGNGIFSEIKTGSAIATALVICLFAYLFIKFNIKFIIRKFTLIVFTAFTPLIAGMWIINRNVTGAAIWFGQIIVNAFMQFVYCFLFIIYLDFAAYSDGWAVSLLWAMMILPLGDVLLNTMQNLVSRIAGLNNEEMANRGIGMGAAMAHSINAIGLQFKSNVESNRGFVSRIKNITNKNNSENSTNNGNSTSNISKTSNERRMANNEINNKKSGVSLYGIGRSFLNTGMYLAEGKNFDNKGLNEAKRNNRQNIQRSAIHNNIVQKISTEKSDQDDIE